MSQIRRITGGPMHAKNVVLVAGYQLAQDGMDFAPGLVGTGPFAGNETTVCLLPKDDGEWFIDQVEAAGGTWKSYPEPKEQAA